MRPIKFRAWNKETKEFLKYFWIDEEGNPHKDNGYAAPCSLSRDNLILMQFTGLTDAEGNEIWEGDLVQYFPNLIISDAPDTTLFEVIFHCGDWMLNKDNYFASLYFVSSPFRVVGNIHQNSELLEIK